MYNTYYVRPSSNSLGNDEPVLEMLLHTLEQTFQAGAVRSRRAYFFYILPFRLSFFACCCHVDPYVLYLFLAYCIQQEGKKLEMRRPVDIDAICLF